jgi:DNA mismatch repair ATPase MutS
MQKSYGIEVMKLLQFPKDVTLVASSYLYDYECDEEDKMLLSLSE